MRYASHYLYVKADEVYKQYAVELDGTYVSRIVPLVEEMESTVWLGGVIVLSGLSEFSIKPNQSFQELILELCSDTKISDGKILSDKIFAYHVNPVDMSSLTLSPDIRLKRL